MYFQIFYFKILLSQFFKTICTVIIFIDAIESDSLELELKIFKKAKLLSATKLIYESIYILR